MGPVEKRIAQSLGHGRGPGAKFVVRRGCARTEFLRDAVGAHGPPFVVVSFKPNFGKIRKLPIFRDVLRREMAVKIKDRLRIGKSPVKPLRRAVAQEEVLADEFHGAKINPDLTIFPCFSNHGLTAPQSIKA